VTNDQSPWSQIPEFIPTGGAEDRVPDAPQNNVSRSRRAAARPSESLAGDALNKIFWLLCLAAFVYGVVQIGPILAERYQYAATSGRIRAEYENAFKLLADDPLASVSKAYQLVAQSIKPSVVSVKCLKIISQGQGRNQQSMVGEGQGSGVIISDDGYIVTNAHVVKDAKNISVKLHDRRVFSASVVGRDPDTDVAVLKIDAENLIPANWGDSENLEVGSIVWAIGTPYELEQTVTSGVVSGKNRYERSPDDRENLQQELIQTDAAVNPGNSGGPLVNSQGKVVGINTSIYGDKFQGISFAVPSSIAKYVANQLITNGRVRRGFLGFTPRPVSPQDAASLSLPDLDGAIVFDVNRNTPAENAGIRANDVIRKWNDVPVTDHRAIFRMIATTEPDSKAKVEILRDGQTMNMEVVIGEREGLPSIPR
jgi:S1-C subfamily serine protease